MKSKNHHSGFNWYFSRIKKMPPTSEHDLVSFVSTLCNNPIPMNLTRANAIITGAKINSAIIVDPATNLWIGNRDWTP